jgi:hypothetical protein
VPRSAPFAVCTTREALCVRALDPAVPIAVAAMVAVKAIATMATR